VGVQGAGLPAPGQQAQGAGGVSALERVIGQPDGQSVVALHGLEELENGTGRLTVALGFQGLGEAEGEVCSRFEGASLGDLDGHAQPKSKPWAKRGPGDLAPA
jgi:hypothetical protein